MKLNKLKVLFISSGNAKTGISPIVRKQGESLIQQGIQLDFFTIKGKGIISYFRHISILRKYLKENNFDIIHAHYGFSGIVALLAHYQGRLVISFMGEDLLGAYNVHKSISFKSKIVAFLVKWIIRLSFDSIIVKSPEMLKAFGPSDKAFIIANGVDLSLFNQISKENALKEVGYDPIKKNILFVTDPTRIEKNFGLAQKAVQLLNNDLIELHVIQGLSIDELVLFYNAADVLLMTSFHEGSPNVIKEAMACNCPIVCTDVGDVKFIFGETLGCYITSLNPVSVAANITKALAFGQKTNGRKRIIDLGLDSEAVAKKIIDTCY